MIPEIQEGNVIKAWLVGFLSCYDSEDVADTIAEIYDVAVFGSEYDPQDDENAFDGSVLAFEAGFAAARQMTDADQIYSVCFSNDDGVEIQPGAVCSFWFVGKTEQAVVDKLKKALAPNAEETL